MAARTRGWCAPCVLRTSLQKKKKKDLVDKKRKAKPGIELVSTGVVESVILVTIRGLGFLGQN